MLIKELREKAKSLGIEGYSKMKKKELEEAIEFHFEDDVYQVIMKNNEEQLQYPLEAKSKEEAIKELQLILKKPVYLPYKKLIVECDGKEILSITR